MIFLFWMGLNLSYIVQCKFLKLFIYFLKRGFECLSISWTRSEFGTFVLGIFSHGLLSHCGAFFCLFFLLIIYLSLVRQFYKPTSDILYKHDSFVLNFVLLYSKSSYQTVSYLHCAFRTFRLITLPHYYCYSPYLGFGSSTDIFQWSYHLEFDLKKSCSKCVNVLH